MKGRWLAAWAALSLCTLLWSSHSYAAETVCSAESAALADVEPLPAEISVEELRTENGAHWITSSGVSSITVKEIESQTAVWAESAGNEHNMHSVLGLCSAQQSLNLLTQTTLRVPLYLSGEGGHAYTVQITLYSELSSAQAETTVISGAWTAVTLDLSAWELRTHIHSCEITVYSEGSPLAGFAVGSLTAGGEADLTTAETFLTFGFAAEGGTATLSDGVYLLAPERNGTMSVTADVARSDYSTQAGSTALCVVLDNAREGGVISLAVADGNAENAVFTISSTCLIYAGENTYLLPFNEDIALRAYRLSFHELYPSIGEAVRLLSVTLVHFDEEDAAAYAGKISVCAFDAGMSTLTVTGSLSASVTAEYIDAQLALFEIPMWADDTETLEPVQTMKISTRFTFTLPLAGRETTAAASRYQAVILTSDGTRIPLSAPMYPSQAAEPAATTLSAIGLAGAENADVFASNASSVILDVYADRLLGGAAENTGGRLCVHGGTYYYLDNAYIRELDSEINFCLSADVEVYLRLLCASDLSAAGYTLPAEGTRFYAFDVHSEAGASALAAVTGFLAERYNTVSGFILGYRLDSSVYSGAIMEDTAEYAVLCADTMRLIYNSAVTHIPGIYVVAPIGHYTKENRSAAKDNTYCDPVLLSAGISRQIARDGSMPWGLLYISDYSTEAIDHTQNLLSQLRNVKCALPTEILLLWQPSSGYDPMLLLEQYSAQCYQATETGVRVMFLSVENFSADKQKEICAGLKYVLDGTDIRRPLSEFSAAILTEQPRYEGRYVFSDFTRAYSTAGWIAGSGCARLLTQAQSIGTERSLHASFESSDGSLFTPVSGNILCVSGVTDNFAYAPYVIYSVQLTTQLESATEAELVFIFGSGDVRAEYAVTVPTGVPLEILCDLSQFSAADTVNFSAISVQCDSSVSMDITKITCYSDTYSSASLAQMYQYRSAQRNSGDDSAARTLNDTQKVILFALAAGSVLTVTLFSRRRRES